MLDEILFDLKSPDLSTRRKALLTLIDYENISDPKRMKIIKKFLENEKDKELISIAKKHYRELSNELNVSIKSTVHIDKITKSIKDLYFKGSFQEKLELIKRIENHQLVVSKFDILKILELEKEPEFIVKLLNLFSIHIADKDVFSIKKFLHHNNDNVREATLNILLKVRNSDTFEDIILMIADSNKKISRRALIFAHSLGFKMVKEILEKILLKVKDKEIISKLQNVLENFPQKQFDSLKRRIRFLKRS